MPLVILHSDFNGLVTLYKDFITHSKSSSSSALMCNVSAAGVTKGTVEDQVVFKFGGVDCLVHNQNECYASVGTIIS
jgi:hypothetical protein